MRQLLRVLVPLLGLVSAAAGGVLLIEVGWAMIRPNRGPLLVPWPDWLHRAGELTWVDGGTRLTAWVLVGAGVVLMLVALLASRHDIVLQDPVPDVTVTTSPRSLARIVGQRVRSADGVRSASVTASARSVRVRATSRLLDEQRLRPALIDEVSALVSTLPLVRTPHVHVVVHSPKDRP
jgi:hypothetical protein